MKLTQVGFIDLLRKINQEKFQTLKLVKEHFHSKIDKVIASKNYQLRCQRLICVEAAKKVLAATTKDSTMLFNFEVTNLLNQYSRILDLVAYFEGVVKEQSTVIAFQEKILSKLTMRINAHKVDEEVRKLQVTHLKSQRGYKEKEIHDTFKHLPNRFFKLEPFELYGGDFFGTKEDKAAVMRDQIYQKQEVQIAQQKMTIESLMQQVEELAWLNGENETKYAECLIKYRDKKQKIKDVRNEEETKRSDLKELYESYINRLKRVMKRDHERFAS